MAYDAGQPGVFGTSVGIGGTAGFANAGAGPGAVAPTFDNSGREMLGKGLGKMVDLGMQSQKNKNVPKFSHIDKHTGLLVFTHDEKLSNMFGRPSLMEGQAYKEDMKMHTDVFNHNANVQALKDEEVRIAEEAKAKEKAAKSVTGETPTNVDGNSVADVVLAANENLTPESFANLKAAASLDSGDDASFGVLPGGEKLKGLSYFTDVVDDYITTKMPLWSTFSFDSLVPENLKDAANYKIGEVNDAATIFWREGLNEYFDPIKRGIDPALQAEWESLQGADGDYDQGKYYDWFIANAGKLIAPKQGDFSKYLSQDFDESIFKQ